ncbi:MAG: Fic domain protein, YP3572 type [uncultured Paraburkholderia sp.]|nr:MAG: Fic domain protein, YP3572 type [uncultured Paraburkholderia sp.]CAH2929616.1 MAG: Fic domain protein, YP3572 type [uncultured Paraburkholderia sp.]
MAALVAFINHQHQPKYDLMKVALEHHRFGWVHPGNGNGRVVRLLTYALLIKYGFNVQKGGRVLNPAAVFWPRCFAMIARSTMRCWHWPIKGPTRDLKLGASMSSTASLQN